MMSHSGIPWCSNTKEYVNIRRKSQKYEENMKKYVEDVKEYVENMKEIRRNV